MDGSPYNLKSSIKRSIDPRCGFPDRVGPTGPASSEISTTLCTCKSNRFCVKQILTGKRLRVQWYGGAAAPFPGFGNIIQLRICVSGSKRKIMCRQLCHPKHPLAAALTFAHKPSVNTRSREKLNGRQEKTTSAPKIRKGKSAADRQALSGR